MKTSLIDLAFLSEKRKDVLLLLEEGPKTGDEIKTALNVNSTSIMPQIKKLKEGRLIVQDDRNTYKLSEIGEIVVEKMEPLLNTVRVFEENYDYWTNHDFTAIPEYLLNRIDELGNYFMLEPDLNRLFEIPEDFKSNLLESRHVKMFLSYFNPLHVEMYLELARKEAEICLILTEPVFDRMKKDYYEDLKFLLESKNIEIYICEKSVTLKNVVTERFCSLVLFDKKGKFDHQRLMSFDESALTWCEELFSYYKDRSTQLEKL
ncbi:winged helix-turn-helix domain-containing protein [Methanosarcina sp.]|jgi:predicted transcriptional regulator|uniref:helix-turn-helix transcriptional regulator n=1 Tax=Methanosarcina sp. TaxID=2213 RepID=UPI0029897F54|nr:winged helix-turn-helix domain-containing protein [Methanosarcina sp.]MDW5549008.1 winged helix-turn-helix domain-containing protein [Methanosarcina sp.]MDW5552711.1 winged helix-turn-helix domain-containing protein [Methanosarcina sp.]MDW5559268.1 winged helix-turn-helix domain-containing protein [Methanosarcina sp.]